MGTEFDSFDDFMGHRGANVGGGRRLKGWKEKGKLDAWLHTKRLPVGVWRHSFPKIIITEDKESHDPVTLIFPVSLVCHEDESVLREMYKRTPDDEREVPPEKCAFCKLIEHVRKKVRDDEMRWTDPVFEFKGATNPKQNIILHAGGLYNAFGNRKMSPEDKKDLKKHGIYLTEAWKENAMPKLSYVFPIVDNDNVAGGVQITVESDLLKQKVVGIIAKERESEGVEDGDPTKNPYCIRLVYRENEEDFKEKYDALRMRKIGITDEIKRLVTGTPPDLTDFITPFNPATLRSLMEKHAVVDWSDEEWDEVFDGVEAKEEVDADDEDASDDEKSPPKKKSSASTSKKKPAEDDENASDDDDEDEEKAPKRTGSKNKDKKADAEDAPRKRRQRVEEKEESPKKESKKEKEEEWDDPCDQCKAPMKKGATECTKCGAKYADDTGTKPPF